MSDIEKFLKDLTRAGNQLDRIKLLRNKSAEVTEEIFWILHFYTTVFLVKGKWPQSLEMMELVMELSDILNTMDLNIHSKYLQVSCYQLLGEFKRTENLLKERVNIYRFLKEWRELAEALSQLAKLYIYQGNLSSSLEAFKEASEYFLKVEDWQELASSFVNIGEILFYQNKIEEALVCFREAYSYSQKAVIDSTEIQCHKWLGFIYAQMGNNNKALAHFQEANRKIKNPLSLDLIYSLTNQAEILKRMGYYREAFLYYKQILELRREIDFKQALGQNIYYKGLILLHVGLLERAYNCFWEALHIFRQIGDWQTELCLLFSIGIVRWKRGEKIDSISFFLDAPEEFKKMSVDKKHSFSESYNFSPVAFKYMDKGITEFHSPPYIGKIQFSSGTIFEFSDEKTSSKKLFQLLEGFLGKEQKNDQISYRTEIPMVNRKVLQEELVEIALLSYQLENFSEALNYFKEALCIILFRRDDKGISSVLECIKEIYQYTGNYKEGIKFFSDFAGKAFKRKMYRAVASSYFFQGNLLVKMKRFSDGMLSLRKSLDIRRKIGERKPLIHILLELGRFHKEQKGYSMAERYFEEAIEECNKGKNREEKLSVLKLMGSLFTQQQLFRKAIDIYCELAIEADYIIHLDKKFETLLLAGNKCDFLGNPEFALEIYIKALISAYKYGSPGWLSIFLESAGRVYEDIGRYGKSEASYNFMLKIAQKEMRFEAMVESYCYLSHLKFIKGNIKLAEELIQKSQELSQKTDNKILFWKTLICSGRIKEEMGKSQESYKNFLDSYKIATEELTINFMEGASNFHLGISFYLKGNINQSLFYLREAYRFYKEELNQEKNFLYPRYSAYFYTYRGLTSLMLGHLEEAIEYTIKALEINTDLGILPGIAGNLSTLGEVYERMGIYEKSEEYFNKALNIYENIKDFMGKVRTSGDIGQLYLSCRRYSEAKELFEMVLSDERVIHLKRIWAIEMQNLGFVFFRIKDFEKAIEKINSAIPVFQNIEYYKGLTSAYGYLGNINLSLGNIDTGMEYFLMAFELCQKQGYLNNQVNLLFQMARIKRIQNLYKEALDLLTQMGEILKRIYRPDLSWKINFELGILAMKHNKYNEAISFYKKAVEEIENYGWFSLIEISSRDIDENLTEYYKGNRLYQVFIDYLLERGQNEEAFDLIERTKAFQRLGNRQLERATFTPEDELLKREFELIDSMKEILYRLSNQGDLEVELMPDLHNRYLEKKKDYKNLIVELLKKYPEMKSTYTMLYLSFQDLKEKLTRGTSLLEYYFTARNTLVFCLYSSPEGFFKLKLAQLPFPEENLRKNLPEELSSEELKKLFTYISERFPELENSSSVYYIIEKELYELIEQ
ncbi:MAG: photosystem I assembly protein Ycf3 [bacterium ADurb.Bin363]|nr:MAG: photosystem I assembly protein Ycf3 [bacterium ADurb.Bin363]